MYVLKSFIILILLSFFSFKSLCFDKFEDDLALRWISIDRIENIHDLPLESALKSPRNTWITVLEIYFYNEKFQRAKDCLLYKVPEAKGDGILKVVRGHKDDEKCKKVKFNSALFTKSNIFNFGFSFDDKKMKLIVDNSIYTYPFFKNKNMNISFGGGDAINILKNGDTCFDVKESCELSENDNCHLCPSGVQNIVTSLCPGIYKKVCSDQDCGGKGEFACPRGIKSTLYLGELCIPDSPVAYCRRPYRVICQNNELICQ